MAYTTLDLQALFEDAFEATASAPPDAPISDIISQIRSYERDAGSLLTAGTLTATSSSGRSTSMVIDGRVPGSLTTKDRRDACRELLNVIDRWSRYIRWAFSYGLDPQQIELNGCPPSPLPAPQQNPTPLTRTHIAEWLMGQNWCLNKNVTSTVGWLAHLFPIYERQSDYSPGRIVGQPFV